MTVYTKVNGSWVPSTAQYTKVAGSWRVATITYVKVAGVWTQVAVMDLTPPITPTLSVTLNASKRYLDVSTRLTADDPTLDRIRVLVRTDTFPSNQNAAGFVSVPDINWPDEAWSEWEFNSTTEGHPVVTVGDVKQYPPNPTSTTVLPAKTYYFAAWALDHNGNWSPGKTASIVMPAQVVVPKTTSVIKTYTANQSRTFTGDGPTRGTPYLHQGWGSGYNNEKSIAWFPISTIRHDLVPAVSIDKVEMWIKAKAWDDATGGRGRFGFTQVASTATSFTVPVGYDDFRYSDFTEESAHWVDLTDPLRNAWKTTRTGVLIGPAISTNTLWHGAFYGHSTASPPKLRITYSIPG